MDIKKMKYQEHKAKKNFEECLKDAWEARKWQVYIGLVCIALIILSEFIK